MWSAVWRRLLRAFASQPEHKEALESRFDSEKKILFVKRKFNYLKCTAVKSKQIPRVKKTTLSIFTTRPGGQKSKSHVAEMKARAYLRSQAIRRLPLHRQTRRDEWRDSRLYPNKNSLFISKKKKKKKTSQV